MKSIGKKFLALGIGTTLALGLSPAAFASESLSPSANYSQSNQVASAEAQIEQAFELIFTEFVIRDANGLYVVDQAAVVSAGYSDNLQLFHNLAAEINASEVQTSISHLSFDRNAAPQGAAEFAKCMVQGALGIPVTAFAAGTWSSIVTAIKAAKYGLAASTIVRALGPAFVSTAGKTIGGPVVIAANLGWAAFTCRGHL